jgi:hypothetical protein
MYPNLTSKDHTPEVTKPQTSGITHYGGSAGTEPKQVQERISARLNKYERECDENFERAKENRRFATNNFDSGSDSNVLAGEEAIYVPKVRTNLETVIPIATQKSPEPEIKVRSLQGIGSPKRISQIKRNTAEFLKTFWEYDAYMQKRMEQGLRNYYCQGYIAVKYLFNPALGTYEVYIPKMGSLIFPILDTCDPDQIPFMIEKVSDRYGDLISKFFKDEDGQIDETRVADFKLILGKDCADDDKIDYIEYWEKELVSWQYKDFNLGIEPNPNFNRGVEGAESEVVNHFKFPKIPYIIENVYSFGDKIADDTTPIETTKSLANNVNRTKRQIDLNQDDSNGQAIYNADYLSAADIDGADRSRQNKIIARSQNGDPVQIGNVMTYVSARGIGPEAINNMAHSEMQIDNEFGTHSVTRGEQQMTETATGRQVLKDSDKEKNSPITRMIERLSQKLFDALIQMIYVFGDEDYILFDEKADPSVETSVSRKLFEGYEVKVQVKDGSTVPRNPAVMKAEIVDLTKNGLAALVDMYKDLGYDDYEGRAKRVFMERDPQMAKQLYGLDGNIDTYNDVAIMHIMDIIEGTMDPQQVYEVTDLRRYKAHLKMHTDYLAGKEIDPDLPPFLSLQSDIIQAAIQEHTQLELERYQELSMQEEMKLQQQQSMQAAMSEQQAMGGMPPTLQQAPEQQGMPVQVSGLTGNTEATPMEASPEMAAVV